MEIQNVIEICVAIIIALLGIAYPIIIDKTSNIGEKYNSEYIPVLFDNEFPQKKIRLFLTKYHITFFQLILYLTLFLLVFLIFPMKPLFNWNNFLVNNSAETIIFIATVNLTITFFLWLNKVVLFNGNSKNLLKHLTLKYDTSSNVEIKQFALKSINEIALYAIKKQDEHIQIDLLQFYSNFLYTFRKEHISNEGIEYPADFYSIIHRLNYECLNVENKNLLAIEHRAVSGDWLLPNDFAKKTISKLTYFWLWRNVITIYNNTNFIRMFWENSFQYYKYELESIYPENYDLATAKYSNEDEIKKREKEQELFLEFHYAVGGLMLYSSNYTSIKGFFNFTQSLPPEYVLLPNNMSEIFKKFDYFRNEYRHLENPLEYKFPYPGLDGLSNKRQVTYWICRYITVLFLRQFTLQQFYSYQNFTDLPHLPESVNELNSWLESLKYFKFCINENLKDSEMLKSLDYQILVNSKFTDIDNYIYNLENLVVNKIGERKLNAQISPSKVTQFLDSSAQIISKAIAKFMSLNNNFSGTANDLKLAINGSSTLISKSAFTDDDIPHINYDSFFARSIVSNKIDKFLPSSFISARTSRYLLNRNNIVQGLSVLLKEKNEDAIVLVFNPTSSIREILDKSKWKDKISYYPSTQFRMQNFIYVLSKDDLPKISFNNISSEEISELILSPINDDYKIFGSVIDFNLEENKDVKEKYIDKEDLDKETDLKILLTLAFLIIITFKEKRKIVQININSEFDELGSENNLTDLIAL